MCVCHSKFSRPCLGLKAMPWPQGHALASKPCLGLKAMPWPQGHALASRPCLGLKAMPWPQSQALASRPMPWPQGHALASKPCLGLKVNFCGLGLGIYVLGLEGPSLGLGLESCSDNFLASPSKSRK